MNGQAAKRDLIVLAACANGEYAMRGILSRHNSLGVRPIEADFFRHPEHDSGVFNQAHEFLRSFIRRYSHAVILSDFEGSGQERNLTRVQMESSIEDRLRTSGWDRRDVAAIIVEPELEAWVWSDSPQVDAILGWAGRQPALRPWLQSHPEQYLAPGQVKPQRPKEALEAACKEVRKPRSSTLYSELAEKVSLTRCTDQAFEKLRQALTGWFKARCPPTP